MPGPNQFRPGSGRVCPGPSGLKTLAPVSLQVSNLRLSGWHRFVGKRGGAAGWGSRTPPKGVCVAKYPTRRRRILRIGSIISGAILLAACGGGSGGGVNSPGTVAPSPAPTPTPTPTPPPAPPPATTDNAEYRASGSAVEMKAAAAYDRGLTGKGVIIAVIDTGIDIDGNEFAGRISADSKAFQTNFVRCLTCAPETTRFSLDDVVGHGTRTAAIALAAKDGAGMHGVAYEATLLALKISAPDLSNVTATSPIVEGGAPNIANIAPAIVYAVDKGAFVTSLSLNGSVVGQMAAEQKAAMDHVRANDRLLVSSVSNWIDDDSASEGTIVRNLVGSDLANKDWFLFGIRVDANLQPPAGNGIPGVLADRTLAVVATDVRTVDENGSPATVTGNSFAAPAIAGAAALLK